MDEGSATVSVRLGDGGGGFSARTTYPVGTTPVFVTVRDINGDSKPDLLIANNMSNTVSVLRGVGDGTFLPKVDLGTGQGPFSIAVADFNNDGKLDLAVSNYSGSSLSIFLGDGAGGFTFSSTVPAASGPATIAAKDVDGDGNADLLVGNDNAGTISVFTGTGNGGFAPHVDYTIGSYSKGVAIADLNGDNKPDLIAISEGNNTVSVLLNSSGIASSTSLSCSPNPSQVGQPVTLTATVSPGAATGAVAFFDGSALLGSVPVSSGSAVLITSTLTAGSHPITATYSGDPTYDPSTSGTVTEIVNRVSSTLTLSSSGNPSTYTQPIHFIATVGPGSVATGTVQFKVDGSSFGPPRTVSGGVAVSPDTATIAVGSHAIDATYSGDPSYFPSGAPTLSQVVTSPNPTIVGVHDVPNDQGGHVFITWRSPLDKPGVKVVTGYRIWRRAVSPAAEAIAAASRGGGIPAGDSRWRRVVAPGSLAETFWEAIATLPAEQLISYAYDAPTTQDSIAGSNPYTAFFVSALTADPFTFYESAVDSGYSVDNLSPPTPAPFVATYGPGSATLHWGPNAAQDFREFRLYRGLSPQFTPGPANLVTATRDTSYVDPTPTAYTYKLAAFDIHGNPSRYAVVTPEGPVAALISLAGLDTGPDHIHITWYSNGNPGLTATVYRRTESSDWTALGSITADGSAYLSYQDDAVTTGQRYGYRLGVQDGGGELILGEVWAVAERMPLALEGARPNPGTTRNLSVSFTLPVAARAELELLDVSGRRVVEREVGDLGAGPHTVRLGDGAHIAPGVYLVRLVQGSGVRISRAVVLN